MRFPCNKQKYWNLVVFNLTNSFLLWGQHYGFLLKNFVLASDKFKGYYKFNYLEQLKFSDQDVSCVSNPQTFSGFKEQAVV